MRHKLDRSQQDGFEGALLVLYIPLGGLLAFLAVMAAMRLREPAALLQFLLFLSLTACIVGLPTLAISAHLARKRWELRCAQRDLGKRVDRERDPLPPHIRYPRSPEALSLRLHWEHVLATKKPRTRLFEEAKPGMRVSRSTLLLRAAKRFEQAGKTEGARVCYR
jgi:hypothetical protein